MHELTHAFYDPAPAAGSPQRFYPFLNEALATAVQLLVYETPIITPTSPASAVPPCRCSRRHLPTTALCSKPADISEFQFRIHSRVDREIFAGVVLKLVINYALRYTALTREVSSA